MALILWTPEETALLVQGVRKIPGRTRAAVKERVKQLRRAGVIDPTISLTGHLPWTPQEDALLIQGIRKIPGRSENAVNNRVKRLRSTGIAVVMHDKAWRPQEDALLHRGERRVPGRTSRGVEVRVRRLIRWGKIKPLTPERRRILNAARLMAEIQAAVPRGLPAYVRDDVVQDIAMAVLAKEIRRGEVKAQVTLALRDHYRRFPTKFAPLSLDAPAVPGRRGSLVESLPSTAVQFWCGDPDEPSPS